MRDRSGGDRPRTRSSTRSRTTSTTSATTPAAATFPARLGGEPVTLTVGRDALDVGDTDTDARATFVFATDDVERLNLVLLLTNFRREALFLPDDQLGRWALAVRTLDVVRRARGALQHGSSTTPAGRTTSGQP